MREREDVSCGIATNIGVHFFDMPELAMIGKTPIENDIMINLANL